MRRRTELAVAQLVEQPVWEPFEPKRRPDARLEKDAVEDLAADRDAGNACDSRSSIAGVHDGHVERSTAEVHSHLNTAMRLLTDDGGGRFGQEGDLREAGGGRGTVKPL